MCALYEDDRTPGERLLDHIEERFTHPFSYRELRMRQYEVDEETLGPTFAGLVSSGALEETPVDEAGYATDLTVEERTVLTGFRDYLDAEDAWIRNGPAFPNLFSDGDALERFTHEVDGFDEEVYRALTEKGAISRNGAYAFFTDTGWHGIHEHTGETVYTVG